MPPRLLTRITAGICLCFCALSAGLPKAYAQDKLPPVFGLASDDAEFIFLVPNFTQLSEKLAMLNLQLQLGIPGLSDAIGEFKRATSMSKGFEENGSMLVAVNDLSKAKPNDALSFLLAVPVSDYSGFVSNFGGRSLDVVTAINLPSGQVGYARNVGEHALVSADKATVEKHSGRNNKNNFAKTIGNLGVRSIAYSDLSIVIRGDLLRQMAEVHLPAKEEPGQPARPETDAEAPEEGALSIGPLIAMYAQTSPHLLKDTQTLTIAMAVSEAGIQVTFATQFNENSALAKQFSEQTGARALMDKLPTRQYLAAMSYSGAAMQTQVTDGLKRVQTEYEWLKSPIDGIMPLVNSAKSASILFVEPPSLGLGTRLLNAVIVIETEDSQGFVSSFKKYVEGLNDTKLEIQLAAEVDDGNPFAEVENPPAEVGLVSQYQPNALRLDDGQIDLYEIIVNLPPQVQAYMGQTGGVIATLLIGSGQKGYITAQDNFVVLTTAPDDQLVRQTLDAMKGDGIFTTEPAISSAREALPEQLAAEAYLSLDGMNNTFMRLMSILQSARAEDQLMLADLPPLVVGMTTGDGGMAKQLFAPMELVRPALDTYFALMAKFTVDEQASQETDDDRQDDRGRQPQDQFDPFGGIGQPPR